MKARATGAVFASGGAGGAAHHLEEGLSGDLGAREAGREITHHAAAEPGVEPGRQEVRDAILGGSGRGAHDGIEHHLAEHHGAGGLFAVGGDPEVLAGEQAKSNEPEGPDVRGRLDRTARLGLLRRHPDGRADGLGGGRPGLGDDLGDAEVEHLDQVGRALAV